MTFTASSQILSPQVLLQGNDTLFCFSVIQSKIIAKELIGGRYCDSVNFELRKEITALSDINELQDSALLKLGRKIDNQQIIIYNQEAMIASANKRLFDSHREMKRQRWLKRLFAAGLIGFGVFVAIK